MLKTIINLMVRDCEYDVDEMVKHISSFYMNADITPSSYLDFNRKENCLESFIAY